MSNPSTLFTRFKPRRRIMAGGGIFDSLLDDPDSPTTAAPGTNNLKAPVASTNIPDAKPNYSAIAGTVASLGEAGINAAAQPNEFGHQSVGAQVGKDALSGAALGTSILPGWGTAIGAVGGAAVGLIKGEQDKNSDNNMRGALQFRKQQAEKSYSQAVLAADPGKETGYQHENMFGNGGLLQGAANRRPAYLLDDVSYTLTHNGGKNKAFAERLDPTETQLMTDAYIYSKRSDMKGKQPEEILDSYFRQPVHNGDPVGYLRNSLNQVDHGATANYHDTPNVSVREPDLAMKAKGGWIKGAVNPAHKGYCTPMTKSTCTGHRRALALTFKKHHGFHHKCDGGLMARYGFGGTMDQQGNKEELNPLTELITEGGNAKRLSSNNTIIVGPSHDNGGVQIPELGSEVEGGETTMDNFVFSKRLGFAQLHKPLAVAKGKIETKPQTKERVNSMKRLSEREQELAMQQETLKKLMGI